MELQIIEAPEGYMDCLNGKITVAEKHGIDIHPSELHPSAKPHQEDIIMWALALGRAGIFPDCGLGKSHIAIDISRILQNHFGGQSLIVTELGVTQEFTDEVIGEGARMGVQIEYVTSTEEAAAALERGIKIVVTNYERVRMGSIDFSKFICVCLDEGNYLKNLASETTAALGFGLDQVKYKYILTATPSPNRHLEIVNYAHFLGVMDRGQILTRFFKRNSQKAGDLTLADEWSMLDSQKDDFWMWVNTWSIWITEPADLGHPNEGYELPELEVKWHKLIPDGEIGVSKDKHGQVRVIEGAGGSLKDAAGIKRRSIAQRVRYIADEIIAKDPDEHYILWHHLEEERKELNRVFGGIESYGDVYGAMDWKLREKRVVDFSTGKLKILATKSSLNGVGSNFQKFCHRSVAVGIDHDFDMFYQAFLKRVHRFGQRFKVILDAVYMDGEEPIRQNIERKWREDVERKNKSRELVRKYGLSHDQQISERRRSFATERQEWSGKGFTLACNDNVLEMPRIASNSVGMILSSFPFGNHYEYTALYNDFGHNADLPSFIKQLMFLLPELLRVLKPGRIAAIHLKNRIHYGSVTGKGFSTFHRFTHKVCDAMEAAGFETIGFHYVDTDVVRENNQTYRLGHSEMCKDSTKMGAGIPEEIWLFRKPQTNKGKGYADEPVTHDKVDMAHCPLCKQYAPQEDFKRVNDRAYKCPCCNEVVIGYDAIELQDSFSEGYSCAQWQIDANAHWRSDGNRALTPAEIVTLTPAQVAAWWKEYNSTHQYNYQHHVDLCEALEQAGRLPHTFALMPVHPTNNIVWGDINPMNCLNAEQTRRKLQNHICLAEGTLVLTQKGYIPIEEVQVGDFTVTHMGRWRKILAKAQTGTNRPVIRTVAQGVPNLITTPEHELWTRQGDKHHPRITMQTATPDWKPAQDVIGCHVNLKLPPIHESAISEDYWWIIGRYLADGHITTRGEIIISVGESKLEEFKNKAADHLGAIHIVTAHQITLKKLPRSVREIILRCGTGAANKTVPFAGISLDESRSEALLSGYLSGDGYLDPKGAHVATSVSRSLLLGMAIVAQRARGVVCSVTRGRLAGTTVIEGRTVNTKDEWKINIPGKNREAIILEDGAWKKVKAIDSAGFANVWDIKVEEDESFTAEGCIVHNCPMPFDEIDRLIEMYSNPDDLIVDPFGGVGSTGVRAIKKGRKAYLIELSPSYAKCALMYLEEAARSMQSVSLFDFLEMGR